jgi:hypothetical protein
VPRKCQPGLAPRLRRDCGGAIVNLTHYFTVSNDKIVSHIIIRNTPVE